jgi:hypothetical protein
MNLGALCSRVQEALDVRIEHLVHLSPVDPGVQRVQRVQSIMLATCGPESRGEAQEVCLVDCLQDEHDACWTTLSSRQRILSGRFDPSGFGM